MKYTIESLEKVNIRYMSEHFIKQSDVDKANAYVELIESTRSTTQPKAGDMVRYTTKYGDYYSYAHIEHENEEGKYGGNLCEQAYIPFIHPETNGISCCTSGGAWHSIPLDKLKYIGKARKWFCDWGNCGPCGNGAFNFSALVSLWEYKETDSEYTTKDYEKYYIHKTDRRRDKDSRYDYVVSQGGFGYTNAFETKADLDAWMKTFRIIEKDNVFWGYKKVNHHVSPSEFEALPEQIDTFMMNGSVRKCKRRYDDVNHIVHTYFVWYWKGNLKYSQFENKIRDTLYTYKWEDRMPCYILARKEA